jgi:hypothetical protein
MKVNLQAATRLMAAPKPEVKEDTAPVAKKLKSAGFKVYDVDGDFFVKDSQDLPKKVEQVLKADGWTHATPNPSSTGHWVGKFTKGDLKLVFNLPTSTFGAPRRRFWTERI